MYYSMNKQFMNKKEIGRKTKMKVYKAVYRPILTWDFSKLQKSKIHAADVGYFRRVKNP